MIANEFLGADVTGKDIIIVDDMISSGFTVIDVAREMKARNARRVFVCVSFGLFTNGLERFDEAHREGMIDRIFSTNLVYQPEPLKKRDWYANVDLSKYMALLIDCLNHDYTISKLLNPVDRINKLLAQYKEKRNEERED